MIRYASTTLQTSMRVAYNGSECVQPRAFNQQFRGTTLRPLGSAMVVAESACRMLYTCMPVVRLLLAGIARKQRAKRAHSCPGTTRLLLPQVCC